MLLFCTIPPGSRSLMELRQLQQALTLAETLNFSRAAERLGMTQPPLSIAIQKLEQELDLELFQRNSTGLKITPAGEEVLRNARQALFFVEEIRRVRPRTKLGESGTLRLGFTDLANWLLLPEILRAFRRRWRQVTITIQEAASANLLRSLEERSLDVAMVTFPVQESTRAELKLLSTERMAVAVNADSPLAARRALSIRDLAEEPLVGYSASEAPHLNAWVLQAFLEAGVQPCVSHNVAQIQHVLTLIASGLGVGLVPRACGSQVSRAVCVLPLLPDPALPRGLSLMLASLPGTLTPTAQNFIATALATAKQHEAANGGQALLRHQ